MVVPLFVGRERSIKALEEAMRRDKEILLVAQQRRQDQRPSADGHLRGGHPGHHHPAAAAARRHRQGAGGGQAAGADRALHRGGRASSAWRSREVGGAQGEATVEAEALMRSLKTTFETYVKLNKRIPPEMLVSVQTIDEPGRLADTIAAHLQLKLEDKQELLETADAAVALEQALRADAGRDRDPAGGEAHPLAGQEPDGEAQKEYYLNEQMQAIQKELGERDEFHERDRRSSRTQIRAKQLSEEATEKLDKELRKLKMMAPMSAEATVVRNYIDWVLGLPWAHTHRRQARPRRRPRRSWTRTTTGWRRSRSASSSTWRCSPWWRRYKGPILCFVGPPGVGKTSLGPQHRPRHGPQLRARLPGRRARRGRDPRPPAHLHRRAAGQDHPEPEARPAATTRSSCSTRWTRCPPTSAATRPRRCWRCWTPSRTTPSTITTSIWTTICPT